MSDCPHTTVKCLCCGEEGTPAHFMGRKSKTMTAAATEQRQRAAKVPRKKREMKRQI